MDFPYGTSHNVLPGLPFDFCEVSHTDCDKDASVQIPCNFETSVIRLWPVKSRKGQFRQAAVNTKKQQPLPNLTTAYLVNYSKINLSNWWTSTSLCPGVGSILRTTAESNLLSIYILHRCYFHILVFAQVLRLVFCIWFHYLRVNTGKHLLAGWFWLFDKCH